MKYQFLQFGFNKILFNLDFCKNLNLLKYFRSYKPFFRFPMQKSPPLLLQGGIKGGLLNQHNLFAEHLTPGIQTNKI